MNKKFLKSVTAAILGLSLTASCGITCKHKHKKSNGCASNGCASKEGEANKCSAKKDESNKCSTNKSSAKKSK